MKLFSFSSHDYIAEYFFRGSDKFLRIINKRHDQIESQAPYDQLTFFHWTINGGLYNNEKINIQQDKHGAFYKGLIQAAINALEAQQKQPLRRVLRLRLRTEPTTLEQDDVGEILKRYNFFDKDVNPEGDFKKTFIDNRDGTISEDVTGLMWEQGGSEYYGERGIGMSQGNWIENLNNSRLGGFSDWRLPTVEEAASLLNALEVDSMRIDPIFSGTQKYIQTCDTRYGYQGFYLVSFSSGVTYPGYDQPDKYVRACRSI